jgi:hypothetical protein
MPEATVVFRETAVLGPHKVEFIWLDAPTTGDTAQTHLADPRYVFVGVAPSSSQSVTLQIITPSAVLSGKVITIGSNDGLVNVALMVVGN